MDKFNNDKFAIDGVPYSLEQIIVKFLFPQLNGKFENLSIKEVNVSRIKQILVDECAVDEDTLTFSAEEELYCYLKDVSKAKLKPHLKKIIENLLEKEDYSTEFFNKTANNVNIRLETLFTIFNIVPKSNENIQQPPTPISRTFEEEILPTKEQIDAIYARSNIERLSDENLELVDNIIIYEKVPVTRNDEIFFRLTTKLSISLKCAAFIKPNSKEAAVICSIVENQGQYYLEATEENIFAEVFKSLKNANNIGAELLLFSDSIDGYLKNGTVDTYQDKIYVAKARVRFEGLKETDKTLCIDFGTSNTTAGSYSLLKPEKQEVEIISFLDKKNNQSYQMLPTMIYVEKIDGDKVDYLFGYDAQNKLIDENYSPKGSTFREIKRWLSNLDITEEIWDEQDNIAEVKRKEIVKAYIKYIIDTAEAWFKVKFKYVHFTTPVKMKDIYINVLKSILSEMGYNVKTAEVSLDEAVAVIYNNVRYRIIRDLKNNGAKNQGKEKGITVIDCGGGTTDVANCNYKYFDNDIAPVVEIDTQFESGNSNYAGNNITYRILQLLKIKIAARISEQKEVSALDLVGIEGENSILEKIDSEPVNAIDIIYADFEEQYRQAETVVPTLFARGTKGLTSLDKRNNKRNYFYLWEMAEKLKKEFFKTDKVFFDFDSEEDVQLCIGDSSAYFLDCIVDGKKQRVATPMKRIEVNYKEVNRIIYADIYKLLVDVMPGNCCEGIGKTQYKLSGQSCQITLFHDLLKEFIPGKWMRQKVKNNASNLLDNYLKMNCLRGSIEFMMDKDFGVIRPKFSMKAPVLNNVVKVKSQEIKEVVSLAPHGECVEMDVVRLAKTAKSAIFSIYGKNGAAIRDVSYQLKLKKDNGETVDRYDLLNVLKADTYLQEDELNAIVNKVFEHKKEEEAYYCVIAVPSKNGYGFNVYEIRVGDEYRLLTKGDQNDIYAHYISYLDEGLSTFFDGNK